MAVYELVRAERERQETHRRDGRLRYVASMPDCPPDLALAALMEEVGEVARAYHDGMEDDLRDELVQVAAVAVAWLEGLGA